MIAAIIAIMLFFTWTTDGAYEAPVTSQPVTPNRDYGILAVGIIRHFCEIDLSVGSMMGLLGGVAAICDVWLGWPCRHHHCGVGFWDCFSEPGTDGGSLPQSPSFCLPRGHVGIRGILIGITNGDCFPTAPRCHKLGKAIYLPAPVHHWRA